MRLDQKEWLKKKKDIFIGIFVGIFTLLVACTFLQIWGADLNVPLFYGDGDYLQWLTGFKGLEENGSYSLWPRLAAPFGTSSYYYPIYGDSLHIFEWFLLTWVFNYVVAYNLFYILVFPVTAVIAYYVMRSMNISALASAICGFVYSFLPYRFLRNQLHLPLSGYSMVPFTILIIYWVVNDQEFLRFHKKMYRYKRNWLALLFLVLGTLSGMYYAFFSVFLIIFMAGVTWLRNIKNWKILLKGVVCAAFSCIVLLVAKIPTDIYIAKHNFGDWIIQRSLREPEAFGLKIVRLFIPNREYNVGLYQYIHDDYIEGSLIPGEGSEYLGILAIIGFLLLLACIFVLPKKFYGKERAEQMLLLAQMNLGAVLFATVDGFSMVFAILVSPMIRGYNRMVVFIAFFSLVAVAITFDTINAKLKKKTQIIFIAVFVAVGLFSAREQSFVDMETRQKAQASWVSDEKFVKEIEKQLPLGAMVFQLPHRGYPETYDILDMGDYAPMRGYLHSDNLRFSYGAFRGLDAYYWEVEKTSLPIDEMLPEICFAGFEGLWIDTAAYTMEDLEQMKLQIKDILQVEPLISDDGRFVFYSLVEYRDNLRANYTEDEWSLLTESALEIPQEKVLID